MICAAAANGAHGFEGARGGARPARPNFPDRTTNESSTLAPARQLHLQAVFAEGRRLMCPIRKILAAVDFSPISGRALERALSLATQLGAAVEVLHVAEESPAFTKELLQEQAPDSARGRAAQTALTALS